MLTRNVTASTPTTVETVVVSYHFPVTTQIAFSRPSMVDFIQISQLQNAKARGRATKSYAATIPDKSSTLHHASSPEEVENGARILPEATLEP